MEGVWACGECHAVNDTSDSKCARCGHLRNDSAIVPERPIGDWAATSEVPMAHSSEADSVSEQPAMATSSITSNAQPALEAPPVSPATSLVPVPPLGAAPITALAPTASWSSRHPVASRRFFPALSAVLAVVVVATAVFAVGTASDLSRTRSDLASESAARKAAESQAVKLNSQVQQQASCLSAMASDEAQLKSILSDEMANFSRLIGSGDWRTAQTSDQALLRQALTEVSQSALDYSDGNYGGAILESELALSDDKQAEALETTMGTAQGQIDTETASLGNELTALQAKMTQTQTTCAAAGSI